MCVVGPIPTSRNDDSVNCHTTAVKDCMIMTSVNVIICKWTVFLAIWKIYPEKTESFGIFWIQA